MLIKVFFSYTSDDYKISFRTTNSDRIEKSSVIKKIFEVIKNNELGTYRYIFDFYSYKDKNNTQEYYNIYIDKAKKCNALVLFSSEDYFLSPSCKKELNAFLEKTDNKRIYPLHMDKRAKEIYTEHSKNTRSVLKKTQQVHKIELFDEECDAIFKDTTNNLLYKKLDEITSCLLKQVEDLGKAIEKSIIVASNVSNIKSHEIINEIKRSFKDIEVLAAPIFTDEQLLMNQDGNLVKKRKSANNELLRKGKKIIFFLHCSGLEVIQEALDELERLNREDTVVIIRNNNKFVLEEVFKDHIEEAPPQNWYFKDCFNQSDISNLLLEIKTIFQND